MKKLLSEINEFSSRSTTFILMTLLIFNQIIFIYLKVEAAHGGGMYTVGEIGQICPRDNREELIPNNQEIFQYIKDLCAMGYRRPGSDAGHQAEEYILEKFKEFGLEASFDEFDIDNVWDVSSWELHIHYGGLTKNIPSYYVAYTNFTPDEGIKGELVYVGEGTEVDFAENDVDGKIAVIDIAFEEIPIGEVKQNSYYTYDPYNTILPHDSYLAHWSWRHGAKPFNLAAENGAMGIIGILKDMPANKIDIFKPYDGKMRPTGLYISGKVGRHLKQLMQQQKSEATLILKGNVQPGYTRNVIGILPGKTDDKVIIASHHDSPFYGAVEDGSGISMVLALAKYYSSLPLESRDKTMVFLARAGHFYGSMGGTEFEKRHQDILEKAVLAIVVEHIGKEYKEDGLDLVPTGLSEPMAVYVSSITDLLDITSEAFERNQLERKMVLAVPGSGFIPSGEVRLFFKYKIPAIGMISGPHYLLLEEDTPDKVDVHSLRPIAKALIEIIEGFANNNSFFENYNEFKEKMLKKLVLGYDLIEVDYLKTTIEDAVENGDLVLAEALLKEAISKLELVEKFKGTIPVLTYQADRFETEISYQEDGVNIDIISYYSDGNKVYGFLYKPQEFEQKPYEGAPPLPLILFAHGGNVGWESSYSFLLRFCKEGYIVMGSTYRGESLYVPTRTDPEYTFISEGEYEGLKGEVTDTLNLLECGKTLAYVDKENIGMIGGSHGGGITALALPRHKDVKAGILCAGVLNPFRWLPKFMISPGELVPPDFSDWPFEDQEYYTAERAALLVADEIVETPIFIIVGDADKYMYPQNVDFINEIEKIGKPYEVKIYPDEVHGFYFGHPFGNPPPNWEEDAEDAYQMMLDFMNRHLKTAIFYP